MIGNVGSVLVTIVTLHFNFTLTNVKVVWSNGNNVDPAPKDNSAPAPTPAAAEEDLPF